MEKLFGLLLFGLIATMIVALPSDLEEWNAFKLKYGKTYPNATEEKKRMDIFLSNKHKVEEHNKKHANGSVTYELGLNKFSDLTTDEVNARMKLSRPRRPPTSLTNQTTDEIVGSRHHHHYHGLRHHHHRHHDHAELSYDLPDSIDWRDEGAVNEGKLQGQCGSCWAFSTVGAIEGQYFRKHGRLARFSEQNLIDCVSQVYPECGCNGCNLPSSYEYVKSNGINAEDDYPTPYQESEGHCQSDMSSSIMISSYERIPMGDEDQLKDAIANKGPISVSIDASHFSFNHYRRGVYYEPDCCSSDTCHDHDILVIGYGTDEDEGDYYLLQNWWGSDWGENGYLKLARNRDNHCGIATEAMYPVF